MRTKLLILLLVGSSLVIGCKPRVVYVPVPCPEPAVMTRPALPITTLKPTDTVEHERTLWLATVEALNTYAKQLEAILNGYRKGGK